MKTALKTLAPLVCASPALAHSDALPHVHHGSQISWLPAMLCIAALVGACAALVLRRKFGQRK